MNAQNSISAYGFLSFAETNAVSGNDGDWPLRDIKESEILTSASGGVNFQNEINSNGWAYSVGLEWINTGFKRVRPINFGDQIDDRQGFIYTTNVIDNFRVIYRFHSVSLPVLISYGKPTANEKWNFSASIGGSPDFFIQQNIVVRYKIDDENRSFQNTTDDEIFKGLVFSIRGDLMVERNLSEKFSACAGLAYRRGMTDHTIEKENDFRSSNYGMKIGVRYHLFNSQ